MTGPSNQCDLFTVGITILGLEFKDAYRNKASVEYQQLASNVTSAVSENSLCFEIMYCTLFFSYLCTSVSLSLERGHSRAVQPAVPLIVLMVIMSIIIEFD